MKVEQFVMAYKIDQDRIRALLPEGFQSLRPVLRINAEIREEEIYIEFNTPAAAFEKKGWLNIANWKSSETKIACVRENKKTTFITSFLEITFIGVGIEGNCPAEADNDGCFFIDSSNKIELVLPEKIFSRKEFCDCIFKWKFTENDAHGISIGEKTLPAIPKEPVNNYEKQKLTAETAAHIPCEQILGQYTVVFERGN